MKLSLRQQVIGLAAGAALIPVVLLLLLLNFQEREVAERVTAELDQLISGILSEAASDLMNLCRTADELVQVQVNNSLVAARKLSAREGGFQESSPMVEWRAVNQWNGEVTEVRLPRFSVGRTWLGQTRDPREESPFVDELSKLTGVTCTVFQRMNEKGDMLRVATTVINKEGQRGTGTFIPATTAEGGHNEVIATVLRGEVFHGPAFVVDSWYVSAYEPIVDVNQKIIGMLYVGIRMDAIGSLRRSITEEVGRKESALLVLYGKDLTGQNRHQGEVVMSPRGRLDGKSLWKETDAAGNFYVQDLVSRAIRLSPGEVGNMTVELQDGRGVRTKMIYFTYFRQWDWILCAEGWEDELYAAVGKTREALRDLLWQAGMGGVGLVAGIIVLAIIFGNRVVRPVVQLTEVIQTASVGNLSQASAMMGEQWGEIKRDFATSPNETEQLVHGVRQMIDRLNSLIGQVQKASLSLVNTADQIADNAARQEESVQSVNAATVEVAATARQISATSQELVRTMDEVGTVADRTAEMAGAGRSGLADMEETMKQLATASASFSAKLSVINERATNITGVVTVISKVAEQTNMLSLNAAIEAEKAGEFGVGFAVVAREIRRLADQTARATHEIEATVREMQSSVSSGVMEMDKFAGEVRRGVEDVAVLAGNLGEIISEAQGLSPRFASVQQGVDGQSAGAQQISMAMNQLTGVARESVQSLQEFQQAAERLRGSVRTLREEISRLHVEETLNET